MNSGLTRSRAVLFIAFLLMTAANLAWAGPRQGDEVPTFTLTSTDGRPVTSHDIAKADLAVVYFFSTKCKPCQPGLVELQKLISTGQDKNLFVLGVGRQEAGEIKEFAAAGKLTFPVAHADGPTLERFNAASIYPTTFIIGPGGRILQILQGSDATLAAMLASLAEKQLQRARPAAARQTYAALAEQGDSSGIAKTGLGYSLLKEGKLAQAETTFQELAKNSSAQVAVKGEEGLAATYLQQGQLEKAKTSAAKARRAAPDRVMSYLVNANVLHQQGDRQAAQGEIVLASRQSPAADFSWQKAELHYAMGNLQRENKQLKDALVSYKQAVDENPYYADALSNQGVALQELGNPEEAVKVLSQARQRNPADRLSESLLRQAQAAIAQKQDLERQRYIDSLVQDLVQQFKSAKPPKKDLDDGWTSPAMALSILGFRNSSVGLMDRAGVDSVLQDELNRQLEGANIKVVDRAILDKLLAELKLGSSELADPDTALKLGRVVAARLIAAGTFARANPKESAVSLRLVDTETTEIVLPLSERQPDPFDPAAVAERLAKAIVIKVHDKYPLRGRNALMDADKLIINLGKKHGVTPGLMFNVLGEGTPIELNGKILGYEQAKLGRLQVTEVEELMAYAKPVERIGKWEKNTKVILSK